MVDQVKDSGATKAAGTLVEVPSTTLTQLLETLKQNDFEGARKHAADIEQWRNKRAEQQRAPGTQEKKVSGKRLPQAGAGIGAAVGIAYIITGEGTQWIAQGTGVAPAIIILALSAAIGYATGGVLAMAVQSSRGQPAQTRAVTVNTKDGETDKPDPDRTVEHTPSRQPRARRRKIGERTLGRHRSNERDKENGAGDR